MPAALARGAFFFARFKRAANLLVKQAALMRETDYLNHEGHEEREEEGAMEYWSLRFSNPPSLHYSNTPFLRALHVLRGF